MKLIGEQFVMKGHEIARITFFTFFIHFNPCQLKLQCIQKDKNPLNISHKQKLFMTANGKINLRPKFLCFIFIFVPNFLKATSN